MFNCNAIDGQKLFKSLCLLLYIVMPSLNKISYLLNLSYLVIIIDFDNSTFKVAFTCK